MMKENFASLDWFVETIAILQENAFLLCFTKFTNSSTPYCCASELRF